MAIKPKLALIPSGVKANKVYSVLPINGTGDFPISRTTDATRINSQGLIETINSNVPRLNYPLIDGVVSGCPSLLLEPQRSNYIFPSNGFSNWSLGGVVTRTADYGISPDGTQNSTRADFSNGGIIYKSPNRPQGAYVFSVFAKNIEGGGSQIVLRIDVPASKIGIFDLSNGTIVSNTTDDAKIEYYGNGWYRCIIIQNNDSIVNTVIGEGTTELDCELFGAMLEEGSYVSSYIKTFNGVVTRGTDNVVFFSPNHWQNQGGIPYIDAYGVSSVPDMFNGLEGVLFLEMKPSALDGVKKIITLSSGYLTDRIIIGYNTNNTFIASVYNNGVWQSVLGGQTQFIGNRDIGEFNKIAISYKENEFKLFVNGTKEIEDTNGSVFNADTLKILRFSSVGLANRFTGEIRQMQYFDSALTDQELGDLTS